eukprot:1158672-Pelagomonas_calceolata.AAC.16
MPLHLLAFPLLPNVVVGALQIRGLWSTCHMHAQDAAAAFYKAAFSSCSTLLSASPDCTMASASSAKGIRPEYPAAVYPYLCIKHMFQGELVTSSSNSKCIASMQ